MGVALFLINLNPLHPRMLCAKFGSNWPSGCWEDENVKSIQTDRWPDGRTDGRQVIRKAHLSFQLNLNKTKNTVANYKLLLYHNLFIVP